MTRHSSWPVALALAALSACDEENRAADSAAHDNGLGRGQQGKADAPGSCAPSDCGGQASSGTCWCDGECIEHGDCCVDRLAVCEGNGGGAGTGPAVDGWSFDPVHGLANLDDDDGSNRDWNQLLFPTDDDPSTLTITSSALAAVPGADQVRLELSGDTAAIRVWHRDAYVLGSPSTASSYTFAFTGESEVLTFEFGNYGVEGTLRITALAGETALASTDVELRSAPAITNHHLQPAERVFAVAVDSPGFSNAPLIDAYGSILGDRFTAVAGHAYEEDVWIQDEFEFATLLGDEGQRLDVIIDSIRDRGIASFAEDVLVGPDVITDAWGYPSEPTTFDAFGNLETSPPVTVGGVQYPFGRIYYGARGDEGLNAELASFLASQRVQAPFELDTTWLCVGHIDEVSTFIPDPSSAKGFKLLLADVPSAYAVLDALPGSMQLPKYQFDHGYATVGEMRNDVALRVLNEDIQLVHLDSMRATFKAELGLSDEDIISVPALFERAPGCDGYVAALIPGMVNLTVADVGGQPHLFVPDPFFRSNLGSQASDPVIADFMARMPSGVSVHFIDDWNVYHMGLGEIHCGTNIVRTPWQTWWTVAAHLLGEH